MRTILALCIALGIATGIGRAAAPPTAPRDTDPWWSPRGTTLAFARGGDVLFTPAVRGAEVDLIGAGVPRGFRPGSGDLLVEGDSSTTVRDAVDHILGTVPGIDATWSPDGTQIAFLEGDALSVSAANGADVRTLATGIAPPPVDVVGPVWSPDGTTIVAATGSQLLAVPVDGSAPRIVFDGPGANVNPSWSPDGSTIAFERNENGRWATWLVGADGANPREVFADGSDNRFPQWSPTGNRLAFLSDRSGEYGLYVGTEGGTPQQLLDAVAPDSPARWSPDAAELAVSSAHDCRRFGIYVVRSTPPAQPLRRSNQCRIDGTAGPDVLYGTPYDDIINGFGGDDRLFGGNGNDVIHGGPGNDGIGGGPGNDVIYGDAGNDVLSGGTGNDVIYAGSGHDRIGCGPGNDTAYIGPGDTVRDCEHVHRLKR